MAGGEIVYFELDDRVGQLQETLRSNMKQEILALAVGPLPVGRQRSRFLAVALPDATVKVGRSIEGSPIVELHPIQWTRVHQPTWVPPDQG